MSTHTTPHTTSNTAPNTAPARPLQVAVIVGSTREGRRGRTVADWFVKTVADRTDLTVDLIDLAELDLPARHGAVTADLHVLRERLDAADAFVVVTPEYNHSYPAPLKHAIDMAHEQWRRKVVGFVSYGGVSGGLRAVEHLRGVFAELHVHGIRDSVSFHGPWNGFGDDGQPRDPASAEQAAAVLVDELAWWGRALRDARQADEADGGRW